jgi:hypothetical protein
MAPTIARCKSDALAELLLGQTDVRPLAAIARSVVGVGTVIRMEASGPLAAPSAPSWATSSLRRTGE